MTAMRRRLLFVTPFAPDLEGSHGGAQATGAIIAMLACHHDVWVLYPAPAASEPPKRLPAGCRGIRALPLPATLRRKRGRPWRAARLLLGADPDWAVEARSDEVAEAVMEEVRRVAPDIVHFEFHVMGQYIAAARQAAPHAACVVTEHEPGVASEDMKGAVLTAARGLGRHARLRAWRRFEARTLAQADAVIAFTESDRAKLMALFGGDGPPVACIPFRLPLAACPAAPAIPSDILFIGNFNHPPNVDAAERLVRSIVPRVRMALPDATVAIVGADPPSWLAAAGDAKTRITGRVEDTAPYLSGAKLVVAPLRQGGGMRVKVIEACIHGKALVATPRSASGLCLLDGTDCILAEDDEGMACAIIALLRDPQLRDRLGRAARAWAERTQAPQDWLAEYEQLHGSLRAPQESSR